MWLWSTKDANAALQSGDLGRILHTYRQLHHLSQERLANLIGYDKTYVSMIETGRRSIGDVGSRRHIATVLGLPPHVLGVTDADHADFAMLLQLGDSVIRLAEIARRAGRAVDAVNELCPMVGLLEARAATGPTDRDLLVLLGQGRAAPGVSLGTVLPEERLATAARTGRAVEAVRLLDAGQTISSPIAPQWQIIERVTTGEVLLAAGRRADAEVAFRSALSGAQAYRLPHQIQRTIRAADAAGLRDVGIAGRTVLAVTSSRGG